MRYEQLKARKNICVRVEHPNEPVYQPSVMSAVMCSDFNGCRKIHSDVNLILRDKSLGDRLGPDVLKSYVDSIIKNSPNPREELSDDEIMDTIMDRRITEATDIYQMSTRMAERIENIRKQRDDFNKQKEKYDNDRKELLKVFGKSDS